MGNSIGGQWSHWLELEMPQRGVNAEGLKVTAWTQHAEKNVDFA
jgi:hypothetical protein